MTRIIIVTKIVQIKKVGQKPQDRQMRGMTMYN